MDDAERPDQPAARQRQGHAACPPRTSWRSVGSGSRATPAPISMRLLDVLDVVELQRHLDRHALLAQEAVHLAADDQPLVEGDVLLAVQLGRRDGSSARQRVPGEQASTISSSRQGRTVSSRDWRGNDTRPEVGGAVAAPARRPGRGAGTRCGPWRADAAPRSARRTGPCRPGRRSRWRPRAPSWPRCVVAAAERRFQLQVLLDQALAALVVSLAQRRQLQRPRRAVDQRPPRRSSSWWTIRLTVGCESRSPPPPWRSCGS